jgi:hypothetical protein
VYEQLLARRNSLLEDAVPGAGVVLGGSGDGAARNALRLRLLSSLAAHCKIVVREELAPGLVGQVCTQAGLCQCMRTTFSVGLPPACVLEVCSSPCGKGQAMHQQRGASRLLREA